MVRIYESGQEDPELVDPIDAQELAVVGFNWSAWLDSVGASQIDAHSWSLSSRLDIGDGIKSVTRGEFVGLVPPAPTYSGTPLHVTAAHVWPLASAKDGDELTVTAIVRAGARVAKRSLRMRVRAR